MRRALFRRVSVIALVACFGHSGCLADRPVLAPDADGTPFMTTTIIETPGQTYPLPGQVIILDRPATGAMPVHMHVMLARGDTQELTVRWFVNRPRPCTTNCTASMHSQMRPAPPDAQGNTVNYRTVDFDLSDFNTAGTCYRLDMYVSPQFKGEDVNYNEPVDAWDIAHARWIFVVRGTDTTLPDISQCAGPTS